MPNRQIRSRSKGGGTSSKEVRFGACGAWQWLQRGAEQACRVIAKTLDAQSNGRLERRVAGCAVEVVR